MKKLMMAAAIAAFAMGAQAEITYKLSQAYEGSLTESTKNYYTLYARAAEDTQFGDSASAIEKYLNDEYKAGRWESAKAAWSDTTATPIATAAAHKFDGKIDGSTIAFDRTASGENYNYFAVIFYKNADTGNEGFLVVQGDDPKVTSTTKVSIVQGTSGTWGTWQTVPEPTSGLLLLLGVAGLALKRKRA